APETRASRPVARVPHGRAWTRPRPGPPVAGRLRPAYAVDSHQRRRGRLARDRRDPARARDPPAPDGLEHARRAAGAGLLDARPRVEPDGRARPAPARAERSRRGFARPT